MASSLTDVNLTKTKELGRYSEVGDSRDGRPHDKSRVLAAEEITTVKECLECGKQMGKVKLNLVCPCKKAIHCSKDCFKASKHKCDELSLVDKSASKEKSGYESEMEGKFNEVTGACLRRYREDRNTRKGPSSEKLLRLMKLTQGDQKRIHKYAEAGNPTAAYVVGNAYMERDFDRRYVYAIPLKYKEQSHAETVEIAVKWLKVAAEGGIPEAMFCLFLVLVRDGGLLSDRRVADFWLDKAYATGTMEYLINILRVPSGTNSAGEFDLYHKLVIENTILAGATLGHMLLAARFRELKAWGGKTVLGEPFYGWVCFKQIMEAVGGLRKDQSEPSFMLGEKKTVLVISARLGHSDFIDKFLSYDREENNLRFIQGVKEKVSPDYQLAAQTLSVGGRTKYAITCKHDQINLEKEVGLDVMKNAKIGGVKMTVNESLGDLRKRCKSAGQCESCVHEAKQRLRAVSLGLFSVSSTQILTPEHYAARYAKEDGVIVQDIFCGYSKPYMRQFLQCLMSNPADLHPLAVAEDANLFWPIIWFWGSVFEAIRDACDKTTLDAIYRSLGRKVTFAECESASSVLAAFPEAAAGEWRIACGNEDCPRVDHEVKFNLCKGCRIRRYCDATCQRKDWAKHIKFCKVGKK